ncbi:MAG TPA: DNA-3-methyladenine glycosylase, partial [Firmicutes bacterium]|nr:DNA-3-methyladenine glycosylase [Bacillota bacterium]
VLIRACEPAQGIEIMQELRNRPLNNLTNGPGKLTQALGITRMHNGVDITKKELYIAEGNKEKFIIKNGPRIGIKEGLDRKWRFWIKDSGYVSAAKKNSVIPVKVK